MEPDILGDVRGEPVWSVCCSHYVILDFGLFSGLAFCPFLKL